MDSSAIPFFICIAIVVIAFAIFGWLQEKKRRKAFQELAARLGLRYVAKDNTLPRRYEFLDKLRQGSNRYAYNLLKGEYKGYPIEAFDYHFETHSTNSKGQRSTQHHHFSFFILHFGRNFPELRIYPEGLLQKLGQMLGFEDIDLESAEFSQAFCVRSKDRRFAYDICNTAMMEYLLEHRFLSLEIENDCLALGADERLTPEAIPMRLDKLVHIRSLFPEYLFRD
ncbi:MAG: DUF3137 domain-containing protein [Candidatus Hydrogenedentes bacterium]|nr:DUF3137 domain-containing protein [Candidatus Hydrogenedentota bacterium]